LGNGIFELLDKQENCVRNSFFAKRDLLDISSPMNECSATNEQASVSLSTVPIFVVCFFKPGGRENFFQSAHSSFVIRPMFCLPWTRCEQAGSWVTA
jgi:hypothetical protein